MVFVSAICISLLRHTNYIIIVILKKNNTATNQYLNTCYLVWHSHHLIVLLWFTPLCEPRQNRKSIHYFTTCCEATNSKYYFFLFGNTTSFFLFSSSTIHTVVWTGRDVKRWQTQTFGYRYQLFLSRQKTWTYNNILAGVCN